MTEFSVLFPTFRSWLKARPRTTPYGKKIIRLHQLYPRATLRQLREGPFRFLDVSRAPYKELAPQQRTARRRSLGVLRIMRRGTPLTQAAKEMGVSVEGVKRHLGGSIVKIGGRFFPKRDDTIQRAMVINEKGAVRSITVTSSEDASIIGKYHNAVRQFLQTGNKMLLEPFKDIKIIDVEGKERMLETNPETLFEIEERKEEPERFIVYVEE